MAIGLSKSGGSESLERELRARIARAIRDQLDTEDLFVELPDQANIRLDNCAKEFRTSPSRILSIIVGACRDLLEDTTAEEYRDFVVTYGSVHEPEPPSTTESESRSTIVRALLARILLREPQDIGMERHRRHLVVPREIKHLLRKVAAHHSSNVNHIVTILVPCVPNFSLSSTRTGER